MNIIIDSSIQTLSKSKLILRELSDEQLTRSDIPPYSSCVGSHVRHILDFYLCIFDGLEFGQVDLTARKRDKRVEENCAVALELVEKVISKLTSLRSHDVNTKVSVKDNLGMGVITIDYTLGALLAQANSHTIHHYAIIGYLLEQLQLKLKDASFGYNPTTPVEKLNLN